MGEKLCGVKIFEKRNVYLMLEDRRKKFRKGNSTNQTISTDERDIIAIHVTVDL